MSQQNSKIQSIQILRAAAALLVVFSHALGNWNTQFSLDTPDHLIHLPGKIGVYTFFVISGYIIWSSSQNTGTKAAKEFLLRRLIRIAPLYWAFTAAYAAKLFIQGKPASWPDIAKSMLFIPYMNAEGHMMPVHQLGWTLNYEMYFYILVAFGLLWPAGPIARAIILFVMLTVQIVLSQTFYGNSIVLFFMAGVILKIWTERTNRVSRHSTPNGHQNGQALRRASWIGDASYSIYLVHPFVLGAMNALLKRIDNPTGVAALGYFLLCLILATSVGAAIYQWVEKPLQARMRKAFQT